MKDTEEQEMHALAKQLVELTTGTGWEAMRYAAIGQTMTRLAEYVAPENTLRSERRLYIDGNPTPIPIPVGASFYVHDDVDVRGGKFK